MVIKSTVSQTSGSFLSMRAGGVYFYFWFALLMSIINCFGAQIQHLQENECKVAHTNYKINTGTGCLKRAGRWQKPPPFTFLRSSPQWVVSRRQLHKCKAWAWTAGTSRLLNEFQTRPTTQFVCGKPYSHEQHYSRSIHITIITTLRVWFRFNQLYVV